jgi:hypothetical protein
VIIEEEEVNFNMESPLKYKKKSTTDNAEYTSSTSDKGKETYKDSKREHPDNGVGAMLRNHQLTHQLFLKNKFTSDSSRILKVFKNNKGL